MIKVFWLSPAFNHYKARFLNHLAADEEIDLTILAGSGRSNEGDQEITDKWNFNFIQLAIPKLNFGRSRAVIKAIKKEAKGVDWILIPAEKKNLPLFLFLLGFRFLHKKVRLVSYNHPMLTSNGKTDKWWTQFYFRNLDRVVFYTEKSKMIAIQNKLVTPNTAYYANNTLDNTEIEKYYQFILPDSRTFSILFIGRLIPNKQLDVLIDYYRALKAMFSEKRILLHIIGDGPEANHVKTATTTDVNIQWHGTLVDECAIAPIMASSNIVFVPGHSGLSINHAFMYGRPYVTLSSKTHAPEIHYLESGINGLVLSGNQQKDLAIFADLIEHPEKVNAMAKAAYDRGKELSVQNWVSQMKKALTDA